MKICGIYKITSPSGKIYIGQSIDIEKRWSYHSSRFGEGCIKLSNSFKKYGVESHTFEIIEECPQEFLNEREIYWIKHFDTFGTKHGMNLMSGGLGGIHSEETIKKISDKKKGVILSEETIKKISEKLKGNTYASVPRTEEFKKNLSKRLIGNKNSLNYKWTEEQRKNLSEKLKGNKNALGSKSTLGYKFTEEQCKNMSEKSKGNKNALNYKWTEEQRKNQSESQKKRPPITEETRKKKSESLKGHKNSLGFKHTEEFKETQRKPKSEDFKKKVSEKLKGRIVSPESIQKGLDTRKRNKELKEQLKQHTIQSIIFRQHYFTTL